LGGGSGPPPDRPVVALVPPAPSATPAASASGAVAPSPPGSLAPPWPRASSRPALADARRGRHRTVVIDLPSRSGQDVTTRQLIVHGRVAVGIVGVRIALETSAGTILAIEEIDPTGLPRAGMIPFVTTFDLPRRHEGGATTLYAVPVDRDGRSYFAARQRFVVGAIFAIPPRDGTDSTTRFDE
jgi:hypothetical protein